MKYLLCLVLICVLAANTYTNDGQHTRTPTIITAPNHQNIVNGRVASFVCKAIGSPKPQIKWRKNGKRLAITERYTVLDTPNGSVLRIEHVRQNRDNATYECLAENGLGETVSALAVLNVFSEEDIPKGFPRVSLQPHMQGVERGTNALIPCKAEGDSEPHVSWLKDMVPIDMSNTRYSFYQSTSLQIIATEEQDSGQYECVAENKLGSAYSDLAQLHVSTRLLPPYFSIPPEPMYEVMPGSDLNVMCVAVGSPMPFVSWKKGQKELMSLDNSVLPFGKNMLKLQDIRESTNYTCVAHSKLGNIESFTQVIVQSLPRAPTNVRISGVTPTSVRLSWSYDIGIENIVYFVIQYKPTVKSNQKFREIIGITTLFYNVRSLSPYTEYKFYVLAVNAIGRGTHSTPVYATAEETAHINGYRKLGSTSRSVQARPLSSSTIVVNWDQPEELNSQVTGYKVYYTAQPSLPISAWNTLYVDSYRLTTISDLQPHITYTIRVQTFTYGGSGPLSGPVKVKTQRDVPSEPLNLRAVATSSTTVQLKWQKPSYTGEAIIGYEVYWNDTFTNLKAHRSIPDVERFTLGGLYDHTLYYIWISAKSRRGEGVVTLPIPVKTERYVPGEPRDLKPTAINSHTVFVEWKAPINSEQNSWLIRGFQIHVQELNSNDEFINDRLRHDVAYGFAEQYNITGLQPDTEYSIQVAAVTRNGNGTKSLSKTVRTFGGVPTRPHVLIRLLHDEKQVSVEVRWSRPNHTYGQLLNYKLKYGRIDSIFRDEFKIVPSEHQKTIAYLDSGARYEIRMAGRNAIGWGQESVSYVQTPEGIPKAPPQNLKYRLQSPTTLVVNWDPPLSRYRSGKIVGYGVDFHKFLDQSPLVYNTSQTSVVFSSLDVNTEYSLRVRAYTSSGAGPYSSRIAVHTPEDVAPAPTNVLALSTSDTSVDVWWDVIPFFNEILGYQVLYTQTAVEDLDRWYKKEVPLTWSAALTELDPKTMYAIRVAVFSNQGLGRLSKLITVRTEPSDVPLNLQTLEVTTHTMTLTWNPPKKLETIRYKITYGARKEYYDSQGFLQQFSIDASPEFVKSDEFYEYRIDNLMPFTTYEVNVTAIPWDETYRPAARITVTTAMSAPKPMVKPDSIESRNKQQITVILPHASEEYGPISHYFLAVVPKNIVDKDPDKFTIEELCSTPIDRIGPYIAAKWLRGTIPHTFSLGDGQRYNGFLNRILIKGVLYQIFVRAVVDAPQHNLFTSSPFSDILSLDSVTTSEFNGRTEGKYDTSGRSAAPISGTQHKSNAILVLIITINLLGFSQNIIKYNYT